MGNFTDGFICKCFKLNSITNWGKYNKGYGKTKGNFGQLLYKTEGRLIPWIDFKYILLFNTKKVRGDL